MATRFKAAVSDAEEKQARATAVPAKTKACTYWGIKVWNDWAAARETTEESTSRSLPTTPLLDMGKFVLEVRKQDGKEYPPKSLYLLVTAFKRFFERNDRYNVNPLDTSD